MKILSLEFEDKNFSWKLNKLNFEKFTLLVGISGVGKTKILDCIRKLKHVSNGQIFNGISWNITFELTNKKKYVWTGDIETIREITPFQDAEDLPENKKPKILNESIFCDGALIAKRTQNEIFFKDNKTPKLSSNISLISLFKEEDEVSPIHAGFSKIIYSEQTASLSASQHISREMFELEKLRKKYTKLEEIRALDKECLIKLFLVYYNDKKIFNKIKALFIEIFPQVEDMKIEKIKDPAFLPDLPLIYIKEKGVQNWIIQFHISSGMFRTILHISELYLSSDGTVDLIDEFENSLGINCINELTHDLLSTDRDIQFIITSHHPYIINTVNFQKWKIITRKAGVITAYDTPENIFNNKTPHEAFLLLSNLDLYTNGIE